MVLLPTVVYPIFLMKVFAFVIFASGYNLLFGYAGLMSFGQAAFLGAGAYTTAILAAQLAIPPVLAVLVGTAAGALLGAGFGFLAIRRQGIYFAMITLALAQMFYFLCLRSPLTGGEDGVQAVPRGTFAGVVDLSDDNLLYIVCAAAMLGVLVLINRIIHSPFGRILKAVRDNEARVESLGFNVKPYKLAVFVIAAALAGFAGGMKSIVFGIATLTDVSLVTTVEVVLIVLVGGTGTVFGPVAGAFVVLALEHYLAPFGAWFALIQGLIFMIMVILMRRGVIGTLADKCGYRL
ncbi:branched-chain amino acid ABC transporter permease [Oceanicola sp. 502str15]|uniref:branched-chain amino acid ABC transporter permease n=1 Tax=Oceanicola sp. 502str15 TaxID=2696061 RepID=UPI002094597B